ncbi:hypothetical protein EG831_02285 [bacterium]|nr:hypothetical protein [bacterium]
MKQITIIAVLLLAASWCFAQSDSAKADSTQVTVEVQDSGDGAPSVTVTTETGAPDSAVTVPVGGGPRRERGRRLRRNWVLGVRANSLSDLPGSLFLQRIVTKKLFVGCGFDYTKNPYNIYIPGLSYSNYHSVSTSSVEDATYSSWSVRLTPECVVPIVTTRQYRLATGLAADLGYAEGHGDYTYDYRSGTDTSRTVRAGTGKQNNYSVFVPVIIERGFRVRKQVFFVGVQAALLSLDYAKQAGESVETYSSNHSPDYGYHRAYSYTYPWRFTVRNPFQGGVSLLVKWYL